MGHGNEANITYTTPICSAVSAFFLANHNIIISSYTVRVGEVKIDEGMGKQLGEVVRGRKRHSPVGNMDWSLSRAL